MCFSLCYSSASYSSTTIEVIDQEIDATNQYIASRWDQFNRSVDTFFTNKSSPAKNKSSIFVYSTFYKQEGDPIDTQYDFQLRIDLPNTSKKLKIIIEKEQDDISNVLNDKTVINKKAITATAKGGARTLGTKDNRYTAGAKMLLSQSKYFVSFIHFGIRLDMPLNPSAKIDMKKDLKFKHFNIGLSQKFNMYRQEGLQEISQVVFNKVLTETLQTDLVNSLVWSEETDRFDLRNSLVFSQNLGDEKGISYSIGANAKFSPTYYYDSYDTSISYRQLLYRDWLYGTLSVGANFPKASNFNDEKFVQIRFDIFFRE